MAWWGREKAAVTYRSQSNRWLNEGFPVLQAVKIGTFAVLIVLALLLLFSQGKSWLTALDDHPIRAYALTNKTQFTKNEDIRTALSKEPRFEHLKEPALQAIKSVDLATQSQSLSPQLKGYFAQDIQDVALRLRQISWIKDVMVRKIYPDRLSITLFEHRPIAIWNEDHFLSDDGTVFSLPKDRFQATGLPVLAGPDAKAKMVLTEWSKIRAALKQQNLGLASVEMDDREAWTIVLDNQIKLFLGRGDWLPKLERFAAIFPSITIPEGKRLSYVDLRYKDGAAVGFLSL